MTLLRPPSALLAACSCLPTAAFQNSVMKLLNSLNPGVGSICTCFESTSTSKLAPLFVGRGICVCVSVCVCVCVFVCLCAYIYTPIVMAEVHLICEFPMPSPKDYTTLSNNVEHRLLHVQSSEVCFLMAFTCIGIVCQHPESSIFPGCLQTRP